ncbi:MAG: hypothetical protein PUC44_06415 [Eubacteriales bacterium]|nr:hypothetical protein [Eubacteriales bacterium]
MDAGILALAMAAIFLPASVFAADPAKTSDSQKSAGNNGRSNQRKRLVMVFG